MNKKWYSLVVLFLVILAGNYFYNKSFTNASYNGLSTVNCIDPAEKIVRDYSFSIDISILGKEKKIPSDFGHDNGQCLHNIFANDQTGTVYVKTNEFHGYTLGNLFDVWHSTFNRNQIFNYAVSGKHNLEVFVNEKKVKTFEDTPLFPDSKIKIVYK